MIKFGVPESQITNVIMILITLITIKLENVSINENQMYLA